MDEWTDGYIKTDERLITIITDSITSGAPTTEDENRLQLTPGMDIREGKTGQEKRPLEADVKQECRD